MLHVKFCVQSAGINHQIKHVANGREDNDLGANFDMQSVIQRFASTCILHPFLFACFLSHCDYRSFCSLKFRV